MLKSKQGLYYTNFAPSPKALLFELQKPHPVSYNSNTSDISAIERKVTLMLVPEDRLEMVEHTLNKTYGDIMRELAVSNSFTEDAVKRLVSQKITIDEYDQILHDHTARLDRIETMLAQILSHLKETPSSPEPEHADPEPAQPEPVRQRRERTFWERMLGVYPDEAEAENPS
jgi:hypothetical protein